MQARQPHERVAQPGVDTRDLGARVMREGQARRDLESAEAREGMALQPGAGDRGEMAGRGRRGCDVG